MSTYIGNYEVVAELGRGGMGVVYKAREESLQRFVAIKMLGSQLVDNESIALRFMREARAVADLNHPNVVQVFRVDRHEAQPYFVMEYVEGESLKELIRRENKLQPMRALQILKEVGSGLAAAHDKGVIHRDIKPENIMLTKYGGVKVVDFGIARVEEPGTRLTTTGMGLGTPSYISPEVCLSQDVDQRSDIFSMGVVLFEMLTGDIPFKSDSPFELMTKVVEAKIPNIKALNPNVDDGLKQILAGMIAKRPKLRYQSCNELISDIEDYLAGRVPRWAKNMRLEEDETAGTGQPAAVEDGEETEGTAVIETSTVATTPMTQRPAAQAETEAPAATVARDSESRSRSGSEAGHTRGGGGYLALAALLLLLLVGGAITGSWYLLSGSERSLMAMFGSSTDSGEEGAPNAAVRESGEVDAATSSEEADAATPSEDAAIVRTSGPRDEPVADADGGRDAGDGYEAGSRRAVGETEPVRETPDDAAETAGRAALAGSARDAGSNDAEFDGKEAMPRSSDPARLAEGRAEQASVTKENTDTGSARSLATAISQAGESSGETLASVATSGAATDAPTESSAMPANPRIAVIAVGDASVAGAVARELKRALGRNAFDVIDEQLVEGLAYAETLAGVARSVRDAGASVLVYADVVPVGERELLFYGRQEPQYLARLEVRVLDLHAQRKLGPVLDRKLEYVTLTADREAREAAVPIGRNVVDRLRTLRATPGGSGQG